MKSLLKTTAAVIALTAAFTAPASAEVSARQLANEIRSSISGDSHLIVRASNGVVTLSGQYADGIDKSRAIRIAENTEGVTKVINHAFQR